MDDSSPQTPDEKSTLEDETTSSVKENPVGFSPETLNTPTESAKPRMTSAEKITPEDLTAVYDVSVQISAVLGRATMPINQLLKLGRGAVVELDRKVGEAIDIYVNDRLVARGEVVVVDENLGITMTEIVKSDRA